MKASGARPICELRPQRQPAQPHPLDVVPGEAAVAAEAQRDAVVIDDDLRLGG